MFQAREDRGCRPLQVMLQGRMPRVRHRGSARAGMFAGMRDRGKRVQLGAGKKQNDLRYRQAQIPDSVLGRYPLVAVRGGDVGAVPVPLFHGREGVV